MNNYHRHSSYSNIYSPDSAVFNEEYAKRAVELGDKIICSMEHGFQGNYFEVFQLAKKYNLKFVYGVEAYWVKNRIEKDNSNNHIVVIAKSDKGRKAINLAITEANMTGYYYKPRLDLQLILSLPKDDVFITTACIAFWKYDDSEDIVKSLHDHFGNNFMLEVQYHHTEPQKKINERIVFLSEKYGIDIIAGMDSHYIYPSQHNDREEVLLSKGVKYPDEDGWYKDYPTTEDAFSRFKIQGILTDEQITTAIGNTSVFESFDDFDNVDIFSKRIKLPTLYPNLTQEEKNLKLRQIIAIEWDKLKKEIPKNEIHLYEDEIAKEIATIEDTSMTDYFLIDYEIVKHAVANGGQITPSGRGSGVSNYTNTILGFSKIDRINASVKMFPERFMSKSRILETGSIPDLDLNLGNPEVFAESQKKIFGENNSYPMIAYGTFKKKSAWKMYAKAKGVDFELANEISNKLGDYEEAYKYADDDEKDLIVVEDFIPKQYHSMYKESEVYQGIISDKKAHPCGWLIYDKDIREEIGLIKAVSESNGNETIVCLLDGLSSENFKFLKNDLLKVDVVKLFYMISKKIGKEIPSERQLIQMCNNNQKVWDVYKNGWTVGVNQVEKQATTQKVMKYQPKNIAEVCAFVAAIRPSFSTMYSIFERREKFEYGIPTFDKIIQDTGVESSFILYQETLMSVLGFAGFSQDKTYDIIKAISKKRKDKIDAIKPKFISNFKKAVIENDGMDEILAQEAVEKVWDIIENSSQYGFNASHSYSYAYDSLLCAYYKSHYPYEFYETLLQEYTDKGNKTKVGLLKSEMKKAYGINISPLRFGYDNRGFVSYKEENSIHQSLVSVKNIGQHVADELYSLKDEQFDSFVDFLKISTLNKTQIETLIKIDYFSEFGSSKKLLSIYSKYREWATKKTAKKDNIPFEEFLIKMYSQKESDKQYSGVDFVSIIDIWAEDLPNEEFSVSQKIGWQIEFLGSINLIDESYDKKIVVITELDTRYSPKATVYSIKKGTTGTLKFRNKQRHNERGKEYDSFDKKPFAVGDVIYCDKFIKEQVRKKVGDEWIDVEGEFDDWCVKYSIVERGE